MKNFKRLKSLQVSVTFSLLIALILVFNSCKGVLDQHLYSSQGVDNFYENTAQAQTSLNGVYSVFWHTYYRGHYSISLGDVPGGTVSSYPNSSSAFENFSWTTTDNNFQDNWTGFYNAINRVNTLLDGMKKSNLSAQSISGQAKFLRALCYFNLVKLFGGVPIYTQGTKGLSNLNKPRSSVDSVYIQIENDLKDATQEMSPYSESDHLAGKATSGTARALLVKVYAQQRKWADAASTAEEIINNNHFGLLKDYHGVLDPSDNNNKELMFGIQHGANGGPTNEISNRYSLVFIPEQVTTGDGTNVTFSHITKGTFYQANQLFYNQTPDTYRKSQSMRNTMPYYYVVGSQTLVHKTVRLPKPYIVKYYYLDTSTGNAKTDVTAPVLRYSDVLLMYAEASNEANGGPTQAAYDAINKVRARARGVGTSHEQAENIYPPLSGLNQSQFRDSVLTEEARELVSETYRRAELLRHDRFISNAKSRGKNAQDFQKLYPIPSEEISRNPKLTQNPGYSVQ